MKITTRAKLATGAVALAGVAALTGGAFTAGGVTSTAPDTQFIGGEVTQTVEGAATLSEVAYDFGTDASNTDVQGVTLTFSAMEVADSTVKVNLNSAATDVTCAGTGLVYTCDFPVGSGAVDTLIVKVSEPAVV